MQQPFMTAISAAIFLIANSAIAAPTPSVKCEASKNKVAGAYYACREKAAAKAIIKGGPADFSKCAAKFTEKWDAAEAAGETTCPDVVLLTPGVESHIAGQASTAAGILAGNGFPRCGDGAVNVAGEHCDGSALDGYTCASFGFSGTLACTAGCDFNLAGCTADPEPLVQAATPDTDAIAGSAKCQANKNKIVGAYYLCREKAEASAILKGLLPDYSKCMAKFDVKWSAADVAGAGMCPDNAVADDVKTYVADQATNVAGIVDGNTIPTCGDGAINAAGEQCDGSALDGYTCATLGMYGTLSCAPGCDFDASSCTTCPAPGIKSEGACWILGTVEGDCTSACSGLGMVYDDDTRTTAGSAGTDASCVALLDLLGAPGGELDNPGGSCTTGLGCAVVPQYGFRARCGTPVTDAGSTFPNVRRVCACK